MPIRTRRSPALSPAAGGEPWTQGGQTSAGGMGERHWANSALNRTLQSSPSVSRRHSVVGGVGGLWVRVDCRLIDVCGGPEEQAHHPWPCRPPQGRLARGGRGGGAQLRPCRALAEAPSLGCVWSRLSPAAPLGLGDPPALPGLPPRQGSPDGPAPVISSPHTAGVSTGSNVEPTPLVSMG